MKASIRANRVTIEKDLLGSPRRPYFSPIYYNQYQVTLPLIKLYARGKLIDLGCGDMPYRDFIINQVDKYDGLDFFPKSNSPTYTGDIQNMLEIPAESYDSAICLEVLEHIPDPFQAVREMYRILKTGGVLVLSAPHLSRLHDEPYDFYRYTRHGLCTMMEKADFDVLVIHKRGGLFSFLGHQVSTLILGLTWNIPLIKQLAWVLNKYLITLFCYSVDKVIDVGGVFAAGYTLVAQKRTKRVSPDEALAE